METIKSKKEFEKVFTSGRRFNHPLVRICVLGGTEDSGRVAFVAAKRLGNAVFRNRCKRVLREAARICDLPIVGVDVIMFATRATNASSPDEVSQALSKLLTRARVV